jgi:hypothetical protein
MSQQKSEIGPLLRPINNNLDRSDVTFKHEVARGTAIVPSVRLPVKTAGKGLFASCHDSCCSGDRY